MYCSFANIENADVMCFTVSSNFWHDLHLLYVYVCNTLLHYYYYYYYYYFRNYLDHIAAKAFKLSDPIRYITSSFPTINSLIILYCALVQYKIEFESVA